MAGSRVETLHGPTAEEDRCCQIRDPQGPAKEPNSMAARACSTAGKYRVHIPRRRAFCYRSFLTLVDLPQRWSPARIKKHSSDESPSIRATPLAFQTEGVELFAMNFVFTLAASEARAMARDLRSSVELRSIGRGGGQGLLAKNLRPSRIPPGQSSHGGCK